MADVSLPMYDLPEVRSSHETLLRALASQAHAVGSTSVAELISASEGSKAASAAAEDQSQTSAQLWDAPSLLLTQMCGLALYDRMSSRQGSQFARIATPSYRAHGCSPGTYKAWIVVRAADTSDGTYTCLSDLAGARVAVNHLDSYSGCVGLRAAVALIEHDATPPILFFHTKPLITGSHRRSLAALRAGEADCASIDCITWALLEQHAPEELRPLRIIGSTPSAPAPPLVTTAAVAESPEGKALREAIRMTLGADAVDPLVRQAREILLIDDIHFDSQPADLATDLETFATLRRLAARVPLGVDECWAAEATGDAFWARLDASGYHFPVSCANASAQLWFNRAMLLLWGFNTEESAACFLRVLAEAPKCAMAHWGVCFAAGVNYNRPRLTRDQMRTASSHMDQARRLLLDQECDISTHEIRLIRALEARVLAVADLEGLPDSAAGSEAADGDAGESASDLLAAELHAKLDSAYEHTMRVVYNEALLDLMTAASGSAAADPTSVSSARAHFLEVAALFAEAVMTPRAWKLWPKDVALSPAPEVVDARAALELALAQPSGKRHPGIAHFYVHMMEAAPSIDQVDRAEVSAAALRSQWPATGHLLHMASHIDMHRGKYGLAIRSGERACDADRLYARHATNACYYTTYRNHHEHQLCWAAMFAGRHAVAAAAAQRVIDDTPQSVFEK